ncbi:MAG TPA: cation:proton antiporter, partial [Candidatus Salinicoccus merdavium]|nr:cation:proton antiporter [Candidatus Salinicoccus merdavium]
LAPIFALISRRYVPDVVWLLAFGVIIGPNMLGLAEQTEAVEFLRELGMGFLFLLAGFEVSTSDMRARQGKHAALTWMICAVLGVGAGLLLTNFEFRVAIVLAIASTSTALGTLLPILKDSGVMNTRLGRAAMTHGAYGELLPIVAMSLLLSTFATWQASVILIVFAIIAVLVVGIPIRFIRRVPLLGDAVLSVSNTTMQTTLRMTVFALVTLMLLTAIFELDIALGAFSAGLLLNVVFKTFSPEQGEEIAHKVEIVGFSFLIPIFFVTSGMVINLGQVLREWQLLLGFIVLIAIVRGLVVFLRECWSNTYSGIESLREQIALGLYSATGLPIIVAVTQIAASSEIIDQITAATMVTGGALTVLIFPFIANFILKKNN